MLRPLLACACAAFASFGSAAAQVVLEWDRDLQIASPYRLDMGRFHAKPSGGWYVTGSRAELYQPPGNPDVWVNKVPLLLRLDAQGQPIGTQELAPSGTNPNVPLLAVDATGGLVAGLTGTSASVRRLDAAGGTLWSAAVQSNLPHLVRVGFGAGGAVLAAGGVINGSPSFGAASWDAAGNPVFAASTPLANAAGVVGAISSTGSVAVASASFFEPLRVRVYAPDGSLSWSSTGASGFELAALAFTPSGELVLAANQYVQLTGRNAHVARWSASGAPLPSYTETAFATSRLAGIAVSAAGEVAVVGDAFPALPGSQDALVMRFDASGAHRWTRTWSASAGNFQDWFHAVAFLASGEIVAGGRTHLNDPGDDTLLQAAPAIACWSRDGDLAWQHLAASLHNDESCTAIAETPGGSIVYSSRSTTYTGLSADPAGGRVLSLRPRVIAFCFGDGSGTPCPCANHAALGSSGGCLDSFGQSALLASSGAASVANDTLVLHGSEMPATSSALYFQGTLRQNGGSGTTFGDGKRCAGGAITRLGARTSSAGASQLPSGGSPAIHVVGATSPGVVRTYQVWYRNSASFCTPSSFNLTNGVEITWGS